MNPKKFFSAIFAMMMLSLSSGNAGRHETVDDDDDQSCVHHDHDHEHEPHGEHESEGPEHDFVYEYDEELGGMVIIGYKGHHTKIHIPKTLEGKPVVMVDCRFRSNVIMLDFPDSVVKIRGLPHSLKYFNIPKGIGYARGVEDLLGEQELDLPHLEKITVHGHSHKINGGAKIRLKDGILRIIGTGFSLYHIMRGTPAILPNEFAGCADLVRIFVPSSVAVVGEGAFSGCTALRSVTLPSNITVADNAFAGCSEELEIVHRR